MPNSSAQGDSPRQRAIRALVVSALVAVLIPVVVYFGLSARLLPLGLLAGAIAGIRIWFLLRRPRPIRRW